MLGRPGATAPLRPLAWELPHAEDVAKKKKKKLQDAAKAVFKGKFKVLKCMY